MTTKTQTFETKNLALTHFNRATELARVNCQQMNADDDTLNATYTATTDESNKRYILVRPDQVDGVITIYFEWG